MPEEPHLSYDRTDERQCLFRAEKCAEAIVEHLRGLPETPENNDLLVEAAGLRDRITVFRRRRNA